MDFRELATAYRAAGWRDVFPLPDRAKHPPPPGVTGQRGRAITDTDIDEWATRAGNVGVRAPEGVIGLDIDDYAGKGGAATLADAGTEWGPLPATFASGSRDDGASRILWYRVPPGLKWPGVLGPGVEIIQHAHRYAVVFPSLHPEGRRYLWRDCDGNPFAGLPRVADLPELPETWVAGLTGGEQATIDPIGDPAPVLARLADTSGGDGCQVVPAVLADALADLATRGNRHDSARDHAFRLIRLGEQGHHGAAHALNRLGSAFTTGVGDRAGEAAARAEWSRIVDGAARKVAGAPTPERDRGCCSTVERLSRSDTAALITTPPGAPDGEPIVVSLDTPQQTGQPDDTNYPADTPTARDLAIQERAELLAIDQAAREQADGIAAAERFTTARLPDLAPLPEVAEYHAAHLPEWRFAGLAETTDRVLIEAAAKTGKSTLVANTAEAMLTGQPLLGAWETTNPLAPDEHLLIIDTELGPRKQSRWLSDALSEPVQPRALVWSIAGRAGALDLTAPAVRDRLADRLRTQAQGTPIGAMIVDVAGAWLAPLGLDENSNTDVRRWLESVHALACDVTTTGQVIVCHHTGHAGGRSRGASAWRDWPDSVWTLTKDDDTGHRSLAAFGRDVHVPTTPLRYDPDTRTLTANVTPAVLGGASFLSARGRQHLNQHQHG